MSLNTFLRTLVVASGLAIALDDCKGVEFEILSESSVQVWWSNVPEVENGVWKCRLKYKIVGEGWTAAPGGAVQTSPAVFEGIDFTRDPQFRLTSCCNTYYGTVSADDWKTTSGVQCDVASEFVDTSDDACKPLTVCTEAQFVSRKPTASVDRECTALTTCGEDQIETREPDEYNDRECRTRRSSEVYPPGSDEAGDYATVSECLADALPGDRCVLAGGDYTEEIDLTEVRGTEEEPITLEPMEGGGQVRFVGTKTWDLTWTPAPGSPGVWKAELPAGDPLPWQLWAGDVAQGESLEMFQTARWPNAHFDDDFIFGTDVGAEGSNPGVFPVAGTVWDHPQFLSRDFKPNKFGKFTGSAWALEYPFEGKHVAGSLLYEMRMNGTYRERTGELANIEESLEGSALVLNVGSWFTWSADIIDHSQGSDTLHYDVTTLGGVHTSNGGAVGGGNYPGTKGGSGHSAWFIEGPNLAILDAPGEFVARNEGGVHVLYVYPRGDADPNDLAFTGKVSDYALKLAGVEHFTMRGIDFFGTTFSLTEASDVTIEDCDLKYPQWNKRALGDGVDFAMTRLEGAGRSTLRNTAVAFTDGRFMLSGDGNTYDNLYLHHIDYSGIGNVAFTGGKHSEYRRITLHTAGPSLGITAGEGSRLTLSHGWLSGLTQWDGAMMGASGQQWRNYTWGFNWAHDSAKAGFRFDGDYETNSNGYISRYVGTNGRMHRQVAWNTGTGVTSKGQNSISHMTLFGSWKNANLRVQPHKGISHCVYAGWTKAMEGQLLLEDGKQPCTLANTINNLAETVMEPWNRWDEDHDHPNFDVGFVRANYILDENDDGAVDMSEVAISEVLRDPRNLDFRPVAPAVLGTAVNADLYGDDVLTEEEALYAGTDSAQTVGLDIGAYQHDSDVYWIPGYQTGVASTPVPPNGAVDAKIDLDLMFLGARGAVAHRVYFGYNRDFVETAETCSPEFVTTLQAPYNVVKPGGAVDLMEGAPGFWRVDAVFEDGSVATGPVWTFTTEATATADASGPELVFTPIENAKSQKRGGGNRVRGSYTDTQATIGGYMGKEMWLKFDVSGVVGEILNAELRLPKFASSLPASEVPADYYPTDDDLHVWEVDPNAWTKDTLTKNLASDIEDSSSTLSDKMTVSGVGQLGTAVVTLGAEFTEGVKSYRFFAPNDRSPVRAESGLTERDYLLDPATGSPALVITRSVPEPPTMIIEGTDVKLCATAACDSDIEHGTIKFEVWFQRWDSYFSKPMTQWFRIGRRNGPRPFNPVSLAGRPDHFRVKARALNEEETLVSEWTDFIQVGVPEERSGGCADRRISDLTARLNQF